MNLQKYFNEFEQHLLEDERPSHYFNELVKTHKFPKEKPFSILLSLKETEQSPTHHPEGNVWNHTMLVVDYAAILRAHSNNPKVFMWGALLHDIGKSTTTKVRKGRITSYDHDREGRSLAEDFLKQFTKDELFITGVTRIVRWHMQPLFIAKKLPFAKIEKMVQEIHIAEIGLFAVCDRLGRGNLTEAKVKSEMQSVLLFMTICEQYVSEDYKDRIEEVKKIIEKFNVVL